MKSALRDLRVEMQPPNGGLVITTHDPKRDDGGSVFGWLLAFDIDAGTTNGSIKTDLPVAPTRVSRNSLRGTINGGGTALRMRTTNGGTEIRTIGSS